MDTPDRAVGMADPILADSINKEWLVASARSSQLSTDLRQFQIDCSSSSTETNRGSISRAPQEAGEKSWLLKHYNKATGTRPLNNDSNHGRTTNYSINGHLYDNISFADSPMIVRSLSIRNCGKNQNDPQKSTGNCDDEVDDDYREFPSGGIGSCFDKYRIFLAYYVLMGITLAIYSRNALSMAAIGMVASNVANKELVDILSKSATTQNLTLTSLDGSCPVSSIVSSPSLGLHNQLMDMFLIEHANISLQNRTQIEKIVRESIEQRVHSGQLVDWTPGEQGLIFAAGSVGNLLIAIPLTRMGEIYGPKWIIFAALSGASIQAALMPLVSPLHVSLVIIFQVVFNGLTFGADCVAYTLYAHWLTPVEMAFFVSCLLICYQMGTIVSSAVTAHILSQNIHWSWCFYVPAILCGMWAIAWTLLGASQPSKSLFVSRKERRYLQRNSKISKGNGLSDDSINSTTNSNRGDHPVSWLKLIKCPNIWAIIAVKFTLRWYFSAYVSLMPTYLSSIAHMSVETIGKMNVFQSVIGLISGISMGYLTKSVVSSRPFDVSLATFRKTFQSIVNFGLSLSLVAFITYDCNQWVNIISLTFSGICINFYVAAALQLPLDLSSDHCGLITSITNTFALGQALGAPISGLILNGGPNDRTLWRIVWGMSILLNTLSGLLFIFLVDSKPRDYNKYSILEDESTTNAPRNSKANDNRSYGTRNDR